MGERRWIWLWASLFPLLLVAFQVGCSRRGLGADAGGTGGPSDGSQIDAVDSGDGTGSDSPHSADGAPNTRCTELTSAGVCAPCGAAGQPACAGCSCAPGLNCSATSSICQVVPVACDGASCGAGTRCNPWAGRCEPDDSPVPPSGRDVGEPCADASECRSNDGVGGMLIPACLRDPAWKGGYCLAYCNAPPAGFWSSDSLPRSNCPAGSLCLPFPQMPSGESFGACVRECRADADCRTADGYYCRHAFGLIGGAPVFSNGYCAPAHCMTRGCPSLQCGC